MPLDPKVPFHWCRQSSPPAFPVFRGGEGKFC